MQETQKRHTSRLVAIFAVLAMLIAACGGDGGTDTTTGGTDTTTGGTDTTTGGTDTTAGGTDTTAGGDGTTAGGAAEFDQYDLSGLEISVGSKDFDEQLILGYILLHAFEYVGATVEDNVNLGGTNLARAALLNGDIDTYMEYNGTGYAVHLAIEGEVPDDPEELTSIVREQDLAENNIHWLSRAPFNNTYGFVSSPQTTEANGGGFDMQSMADYLEANPDTNLCLESEFPNRDDGLILFEEATGYTVPESQITILQSGLIYTETANETCQFGEVFTSDGRIDGLGLTLVEDPGVMILYNVSVNMRDDLYQEAPETFDAMAEAMLSGLTQETMNGLNTQVSYDGEAASDVARQYLVDQGLISSG